MQTLARIWYLLVGVVAAIHAAGPAIAPVSSGCRITVTQEGFDSTTAAAPNCIVFLDVPVMVGFALLAVLIFMAIAWSVADPPPRGMLARIGIFAGIVGSFTPAFLLASIFGSNPDWPTPTEIALHPGRARDPERGCAVAPASRWRGLAFRYRLTPPPDASSASPARRFSSRWKYRTPSGPETLDQGLFGPISGGWFAGVASQ